MNGYYEEMKGGKNCEEMEELKGGVKEMFELKKEKEKMYRIMMKEYER